MTQCKIKSWAGNRKNIMDINCNMTYSKTHTCNFGKTDIRKVTPSYDVAIFKEMWVVVYYI